MTSLAPQPSPGAARTVAGGPQGRLVLELRAGERIIVNGAVLQVRARTTLVLNNRARFLFGRQVLDESEATTPARRLYLALQAAYAGDDGQRHAAVAQARALILDQTRWREAHGRTLLRQVEQALENGEEREALLLTRRLFAEDDAVALAPVEPATA